jgi:hypothetical protein
VRLYRSYPATWLNFLFNPAPIVENANGFTSFFFISYRVIERHFNYEFIGSPENPSPLVVNLHEIVLRRLHRSNRIAGSLRVPAEKKPHCKIMRKLFGFQIRKT